MAIDWQKQTFNNVATGNPAVALAAASRAFGNIQSNISDRKQAESLAAYRDNAARIAAEELEYKLGAEDRAIAKEERDLAKSVEKGLLAEQLAKDVTSGVGTSARGDTLFSNMRESNDPRMLELTGMSYADQAGPVAPEALQEFDKFTEQNATAIMPAAEFKDNYLASLMKTGKIPYQEALNMADAKTSEKYPTMSPDMIKAGLSALPKPGNTTNVSIDGRLAKRSSSGSFKPWSSQPSVLDEDEIHKNFMEIYPIDKDEDEWYEIDWKGWGGKEDITQGDVRFLSNMMKKEGIHPAATYGVLESRIIGNNTDFDPRNMTDNQKEQFKNEAKQIMAQQQQGYNTKTGAMMGTGSNSASGDPYLNQYMDKFDEMLSRGTTKKFSDDEIFQAFLDEQGPSQAQAQSPAQRQAPTPSVNPATDPILQNIPTGAPTVDTVADPAVQPVDVLGDILGNIPAGQLPEKRVFGMNPNNIPDAGADQLLRNIGTGAVNTGKSVFGGIESGLAAIQNFKDKSYAKQTTRVTDAITKTGSLQGISGSDIKVALADKNLSKAEKDVIRRLSKLRTR